MLNYIWGFMIIIGVIYGAVSGNIAEVTNAAINSAKEAVTLCITMVGIMSLWMGLMEIASDTGIIAKFTKAIQPFISFMFPQIPKAHKAREYISTNVIANVLGLGWAATPAGLQAMKSLEELEEDRRTHNTEVKPVPKGVANKEMCTFLILNISSLQLIPVNMIAYRSQYGSVNPAMIIMPCLIATTLSTIAGAAYAKIMAGKHEKG